MRPIISKLALVAVLAIYLDRSVSVETAEVSNNRAQPGAETPRTDSIIKVSKPVATDKDPLNLEALGYLQKYGYLNSTTVAAGFITAESFSNSMKQFQRAMGLAETGIADKESLAMMAKPRCGNQDTPKKADKNIRKQVPRRKRFVMDEEEKKRPVISYKISKYPTKLSDKHDEVDSQIRRAFDVWSKPAKLDFEKKDEGKADLNIEFASSFVNKNGTIYFDDRENWNLDSSDLYKKAVHVLGHTLGLKHKDPTAIVAPDKIYENSLGAPITYGDIENIKEFSET